MFAQHLSESIIKRFSIRVKELEGVNLGQGIPSFPTAGHIRDAARVALEERDIGVYPNFLGTPELRNAIAERLSHVHGTALESRNILITVGAMEATSASVLSILSSGDIAGIVTPDYCNHFPVVDLAKGTVREIAMMEGEHWQIDMSTLEKAAKDGMKLLIITNPNNPTGAVLLKEQIQQILELSRVYSFWIISDETYSFLSYDRPFVSFLDFWSQSDRLIVLRSFSKEYAMTGWRVGYVVARGDTLGVIAKTHDALVGCAPKISQRAAMAAVVGPQTIVGEYVSVFRRRRDLACRLLDGLKDYLVYAKPQGAYYIFPKYKMDIDSLTLSQDILEKAHVAVIPGSAFGTAGEGHIRLSFAVEDDVLVEGVGMLRNYFER
ncbi:MAG: pyridoxal phosphate-dependent aminotransferase [bacterium]|nr:pyridoxal phosphate-dependent aminotransferase [bacterium]